MAHNYQNVGTPRIFIDLYDYLNAIGQIHHTSHSSYFSNPGGGLDSIETLALGPDSPVQAAGNMGNYLDPGVADQMAGVAVASSGNDLPYTTPFGLDPTTTRVPPWTDSYQRAYYAYRFEYDFPPYSPSLTNPNSYVGGIQNNIISNAHMQHYINYAMILGHKNRGFTAVPCISGYMANDSDELQPVDHFFLDGGYENIIGTQLKDINPGTSGDGTDGFIGLDLEYSDISIALMKNGLSAAYTYSGSGATLSDAYPNTDRFSHRFEMRMSDNMTDLTSYGGISQYPECCSISVGSYYDFPHSPNLRLSMTKKFDGVDSITTRGGKRLSNVRYGTNPAWGTGEPAWTIGSGYDDNDADPLLNPLPGFRHNMLGRAGKRSWNISFDMLADSDLMGIYESSSAGPFDESQQGWTGGWADTAYVADTSDTKIQGTHRPLYENNDLYGRFLLRTLGGQIPFVFQPDSSNANPDQFAICVLKKDSFRYTQKGHKRYNIQFQIEEVW